MPGINDVVTTTVLNTNIIEVERKIPDVNGLETTAVFNTEIRQAENKISSVINVVNGVEIYKFKAKDSKNMQLHYIWVMFENSFQLTKWERLDSMVMFKIFSILW